jgi:phage FluMu gp28-like protein
LQGLGKINGERLRLYDYQIANILCQDTLQIYNKARQVGFSFVFAVEALAKAMLRQEYTAIFVSINDEESKEKIRDAEIVYDSIPLAWKKRRIGNTKSGLEFENSTGFRTRLTSHPQRPVRGKSADVFLDEFAHYQYQNEIYVSAIPVISRGKRVLKIASTPLGQSDLFHEICENKTKYGKFIRTQIFWWDCPDFCTDVFNARLEAPGMPMDQRVQKYGSEKIKIIYESMDHDDFAQEYECSFANEETCYYPYELLTPCAKPRGELTVYKTLDDFIDGYKNTRGILYAGLDVGRVRDNTEFWILEKLGDRFHDRLLITLNKTDFDTQEKTIWGAMAALPIRRLCIDETGLGKQLAERTLKKFGKARVEPVNFSNETKEDMAITLHRVLEKQDFYFRADRDIIGQFHSIKRILLPGGKHRYDTLRNAKHHADKVWAAALAIRAGSTAGAEIQVRFL